MRPNPMPYSLILAFASVVLTVRYAADSDASLYGRLIAVVATVVSFAVPGSTVGQVVSILLRLAVSVFVLVRIKLLAPSR